MQAGNGKGIWQRADHRAGLRGDGANRANRANRRSEARGDGANRANRGFTLTETMAALLIFVLLSAFVANGIPAAVRAYQQVTSASNAQVALSTTASALRDELGLAVAVQTDSSNNVQYYQSPEGYWVHIENPSSESQRGLQKHLFQDVGGAPMTGGEISGSPIPLIPESAVASASGTTGLQVTSGGITYENGKFTVLDLKAVKAGSGDSVEAIEAFKVRAVLGPEATVLAP